MIKLVFIRHGKTAGNLQNKYIGMTDEPLSKEGIKELKSRVYPDADIVYTSCLKRTIMTADIIYPNKKAIQIKDFNECDFGDFEDKNYIQLQDNQDYQRWIDSQGQMDFPNGENHISFKKRCVEAFCKIINERKNQDITLAFVVHGGTIMSIFENLATEEKSFYNWHVKNADGYTAFLDSNGKISIVDTINIHY